MKKTILRRMLPAILLPLAGLALMLAINACDLLGAVTGPDPVTVSQRLNNFIAELNTADRSQTNKNFHPTETDAYPLMASAAYWDAGIWAQSKQTFGLGTISPSAEDADGIVTVITTLTSADPTLDIRFTLKEKETDVWYIKTIDTRLTSATDWTQVIRTIGGL